MLTEVSFVFRPVGGHFKKLSQSSFLVLHKSFASQSRADMSLILKVRLAQKTLLPLRLGKKVPPAPRIVSRFQIP